MMKYNLAMKLNEVLIYPTIQRNLKMCEVKEVTLRRSHIVCFHLNKMSRMDKFIEIENRLVAARG